MRLMHPLLIACLSLATSPATTAAQGPPRLQPKVFAIRDARIVLDPGRELARATIVIRDGIIESVGAQVKAPSDALVIEGQGLVVYPGFIDALSHWGFDSALRRSESGPAAMEDYASEALAVTKPDNRKGMTPEFSVVSALKLEDDLADTWRRLGFTAHLAAPEGGLLAGQSALLSLSGSAPRESVLRAPVAQHAAFRTTNSADYPRVLMGFIAHTRQTLLDAGHHARLVAAFEQAGRRGPRPPVDAALEALSPLLRGEQQIVFEADTADEIHRCLDFCQEFHLKPIIVGGKDAWKVKDRLRADRISVIARLAFTDPSQARPGRRGFGPPPAPGAAPAPPEEPPALPSRVKADRERQLREEIRNISELRRAGIPVAISTVAITGDKPSEKFKENLRKLVTDGDLKPADVLDLLTRSPARLFQSESQLGSIAPGKAAHLAVFSGDFLDAKSSIRHLFSDGRHFAYETPEVSKSEAAPGKPGAKEAASQAKEPRTTNEKGKTDVLDKQATELELDRRPKLKTNGNVLIKNATLLTVTKGVMRDADLLIQHGKISQIGRNIQPPEGVTVVPAYGMFAMPGIIDTHCHFAVSGSVNEFSLSIVPEVRIKDVIDSEDVQMFRALAGGVTVARLLHGSANVIGGQDAVIKLKMGKSARDLILQDAPRGVKLALGENVKRTDGRFPNTRLGVEAALIRAFTEALAYQKLWSDYRTAKLAGKTVVEPRRDLRLEALADVLSGDLKVHCHCYRADEILMLLRVADRFGFRIQSLQHVLEGYKVAPEIAQHGASCSTFSDWWAYKIEAFDAIPYNAALLHQAGAVVCMKSDDNELMRHLYQEAAKALKYGGMNEAEALATITINPAKQLGLEKRMGSLEVGKDGDVALFSGHPLNTYSRPELTLIDGEVYFQRNESPRSDSHAQAIANPPSVEPLKLPGERAKVIALRGATIHPVSQAEIPAGNIIVQGQRILRMGPMASTPAPAGATIIDVTGLHIYPGMIDTGTVLGLTELGSAKETQDFAEGGDFQPDLHASTGINPDSELIPVTRANGVLSVVTRPTGGLVAGQSALINLVGWVPREMVLRDPLTLHLDLPSSAGGFGGDPTLPMVGRAIAKKQREEKIKRLKELFKQALAYDEARKQSTGTPANPRLEALVPYARGQRPVMIQAQRRQEILDALKLADDLKIKMMLTGGLDAAKVAEELKKRDIPVLFGPVMRLPAESYDPFDGPYATPAKLHEAGVKFCIRSAGTTNTRNLPYEAAMAVAYGLSPEEALKAVTLYPAQILGIEKELGSLGAGMRANLVISTGDILQVSSVVKAVVIDGKVIEPSTKHTKLYERYRERLREVREGRSPLGPRQE